MYIAEMLCGNPFPMELALSPDSSYATQEAARDYVDHCGRFWREHVEAIPFLHWLYNQPKVLIERGGLQVGAEALFWERDFTTRKALVEGRVADLATIDDRLSREILVERLDREGRPAKPWIAAQERRRLQA